VGKFGGKSHFFHELKLKAFKGGSKAKVLS
jgi:hypothetical protein